MSNPYFIAEVGVNFYDTARALGITAMDAAKLYIKEAGMAGVDAVKFQSYKADTIVSKRSPAYWDLSKEPTRTQYELFQRHDGFGREDYGELCRYCREVGVDFMSTPFDYASADYLDEFVDVYKISSSDLTNLPFIRHIARKAKPVFLSVGASYVSEVDEAVRAMRGEGCRDICLLHCVLSYPTRNEDANLNVIRTLGNLFPDLAVGYSDHTVPDETMTILTTAYLLGARVIEKHFTLDKTLPGNDHYHAGDPDDFRRAVANFRLVHTVLGSPQKTVLPCEAIPRRQARRSLVLARDMKAGETLAEGDLIPKRPGTGVPPKDLPLVIGRTLRRDMEQDSILEWKDV